MWATVNEQGGRETERDRERRQSEKTKYFIDVLPRGISTGNCVCACAIVCVCVFKCVCMCVLADLWLWVVRVLWAAGGSRVELNKKQT